MCRANEAGGRRPLGPGLQSWCWTTTLSVPRGGWHLWVLSPSFRFCKGIVPPTYTHNLHLGKASLRSLDPWVQGAPSQSPKNRILRKTPNSIMPTHKIVFYSIVSTPAWLCLPRSHSSPNISQNMTQAPQFL